MKISPKQANLLAKEIFNQLKTLNIWTASPMLVAKVQNFKIERDKLVELKDKAEKAIEQHDKKLKDIIGKKIIGNIRCYYDADNIIQKVEEANTPSIPQIEDKILLKSMFASEQDMETFVATIINDFTKKKNVVI